KSNENNYNIFFDDRQLNCGWIKNARDSLLTHLTFAPAGRVFAPLAEKLFFKRNFDSISKKKWWKGAIVYQVNPRSFKDSNGDGVGDLQGMISKLNYLQSLGIDVVWVNPIYSSPNDDNGYDISDYWGIMKEFGSMKDFDELLQGLHKRNIKLVMDLV